MFFQTKIRRCITYIRFILNMWYYDIKIPKSRFLKTQLHLHGLFQEKIYTWLVKMANILQWFYGVIWYERHVFLNIFDNLQIFSYLYSVQYLIINETILIFYKFLTFLISEAIYLIILHIGSITMLLFRFSKTPSRSCHHVNKTIAFSDCLKSFLC